MCSSVFFYDFSTTWLLSWTPIGFLPRTTLAYSLDTVGSLLWTTFAGLLDTDRFWRAMASREAPSGTEPVPSTSSGVTGTEAESRRSAGRHFYTDEVVNMWNLAKVIRCLGSTEQCVQFAEDKDMISTEKLCRTHRKPMHLAKSTNKTFGSWVCTKGQCKQKSKVSRTNGTFFENIHVPLVHVFYLIYAFAHKWSYNMTINEDPYKSENKQCLSRTTISDWFNYCREAVVIFKLENNENKGKIGGPGRIVQIDESKFGKRKYNKGN